MAGRRGESPNNNSPRNSCCEENRTYGTVAALWRYSRSYSSVPMTTHSRYPQSIPSRSGMAFKLAASRSRSAS